MWNIWGLIVIVSLTLSCTPSTLRAGLYFFKDKRGVLHITNVAPPTALLERRCGQGHFKGISPQLWSHIEDASLSSGIDPLLLAALVLVESGGDPRAHSKKGAIGLTQLMPKTAKDLRVNPFDPVENLRGGAQYLRYLMERFDGDLIMALAAYNAGPGAVEKRGGIPPYRETHQYVKKVLITWRELTNWFSGQ